MSRARLLELVRRHFPLDDMCFAFAYGSGVKPQTGKKADDVLIDLVFVVRDSARWHATNLAANRDHYSFLLQVGGAKAISSYQEKIGAKILFNTLITLKSGDRVKYGVISQRDFLDDLQNWPFLYVAGRLHKPVTVLLGETDEGINAAMHENRISALRTALLLSASKQRTVTDLQLLHTIARLSYDGDIRTWFAEDKKKVENIVTGNLVQFRELYMPYFVSKQQSFSRHYSAVRDGENYRIVRESNDTDYLRCFYSEVGFLPTALRERVIRKAGNSLLKSSTMPNESADCTCSEQLEAMTVHISKALKDIVFQSSWRQTAKGLSVGLTKSVLYGGRKVYKGIKSMIS